MSERPDPLVSLERWLLLVSLGLLVLGFVLGALAVHLSRCR